ncbi:putative set and mynd domain protein [Neofusicoccum parvum UCRNP2]|uniref:Putative set and mynd domain protein n=1 Tax=Botryosphaeria parva (strain UCR-NP2) TaxID=1287680 RepID=R1EKC3_BOTPV|nr:putative set and mynd domain protein [Neofusicoccum parvum UCRNP2]
MAESKAYKKKSPIAGNGLFATQDIPAGESIFSLKRPLITVLDNVSLDSCCANCFASTGFGATNNQLDLKACTGCRTVKYCGRTCQSQSWKRHHKFECPVLKVLGPERQLPNAVRAVIQILTMRKNGLISDADWEALQGLPSHLDELRVDPDWERHAVLAMGALKYSKAEDMFSANIASGIYARILTNSLTLIGSALEPLGISFDPLACSANHSCDPNAFVIMDGAQLSYRALNPIAKDEEISISYVDPTNPFERRQTELRQRYHFACACTKCAHGASLREDRWLPSTSDLQVAKPGGIEGTAFAKLEQARGGSQYVQDLAPVEQGLEFCADTGVYPADRQPYAAMRDEYIVGCLYAGRFVDAWMHAVRRYFDVDPLLYPQPHHPLRVVHKWSLAMLTLVVAQDHHEALAKALGTEFAKLNLGVVLFGVLVETVANVPASHGGASAFAKMVMEKFEQIRVDMTRGDDAALAGMKTRIEEQWVILRKVGEKLPF